MYVTTCLLVGLAALTYTIVRADPTEIRLDLIREGAYKQTVTSAFAGIQANASSVVESCGLETELCLAAANRLDLSVRGLWADLAKVPLPPCFASIDAELRRDSDFYDRAALAILADSSTPASRTEAVTSIAITQQDVERTLHSPPRCGFARLSTLLPSN